MQDRYARQIVLPELGAEGQKRLGAASVLCIGAGGLGSPALMYLAAAGIGRIGLVDDDTVDISNLQRQVLFKESDQGEPKVEAARRALESLNSTTNIEHHNERFTADNAEKLLRSYDVVIDGADNFSSKFLINDACVKYGKPLVYGSILGFIAQVAVFWAEHGACYRCLYPKPPSGHIPNCAEAGVIGAMAGISGATQALETIKMVLGLDWCKEKNLEPLLGTLWLLDARSMETKRLKIPKRQGCPVCSVHPDTIVLEDAPHICSAAPTVKTITAQEAQEMHGSAVFIDVRELHELASGKISDALHIPLGILLKDEEAVRDIAPDASVVVYCQHGVRSASAASHLTTLGFTNVAHLAGGIVRWKSALS